jgi:hypothetical protein
LESVNYKLSFGNAKRQDLLWQGSVLVSCDLKAAGKFPKSNFQIALALNRLRLVARQIDAVAQGIYNSRACKEQVFAYKPQVCASVSVCVFV